MSRTRLILCCTLFSAFACTQERDPVSPVVLELVADGFVHPLLLTEPPDDSGRLFVLDQVGKIWIIRPDGKKLAEPFLDLSKQLVELDEQYDERGLLGLAFHPDYANNGRFYVFYSIPLREQALDNFNHTNVLAEFRTMPDNPDRADLASERRLLEIDHPYMNHNAGTVAFGPDGMLYLSLGDGGNRDDQDLELVPGHVEDWYEQNGGGNGQDIEDNLLGSILRIDVDKAGEEEEGEKTPYAVPEDNPFSDIEGVEAEVWAYGFRNPYRFTIDPGGSHALIAGDAGQDMFEEISLVTRGGNYGWNVYEGAHCFNAASPMMPFDSCPTTVGIGHPAEGDPLIPPVIELKNTNAFAEDGVGLVVVGGVVNRGEALPAAFRGRYVFGMWSIGEQETQEGELHKPGRLLVADMRPEGSWPWEPVQLQGAPNGELDAYLLGFGQDRAGNVYVLTSEDVGPTGHSGKVRRLSSL
jgi:glucose/arabinose dehydrogenase